MGWRVKNDNLLDPRLCARCGNSGLVYCTWEMNVVFPVPSAGTGVFVVQGQSPNCSLVCTRTPSHLRARSVAECLKKFKLLPNIQGNVGPKSAQNFTNSFDMNGVMLPSHAASESAQPSLDRYYQCTGVANGMRGSKSSFSGCFCTAPFEKKLQLLI